MHTRPLFTACIAVLLAFVATVAAGCQGNVFALKVGDCFDGVAAGEISDVNTVACTASHDSEVFSVFDYPSAPSDFPGDAAMQAAAAERCPADFKTYVGVDATASQYVVGQVVPTADSWRQGDRTVVCVLHVATIGQKVTVSAKGAAN